MKIAYLILAHRNPRLVQKAMAVLAGEDASFFIHIDAKADFVPFAVLRGPRVFFTEPRLPVYWGEYSQTAAILLLIGQALGADPRPDYLVLMSGSDFPLRSGRYIRDFLTTNRGKEFITMVKMPGPGKPLSRINTLRFPSTRPLLRFVFRALAKAGLAQRDYRRHLGGLEPYAGHTWWTLSRAACEHLLDYLQRHPTVPRFFANTHAPDECLFHTILANSPFQSQIRRHLVFEDWRSPAAHPEMINTEHLEYFESQNKVAPRDGHGPGELLFARKFSDEEIQLADRVVAMIARKEKLPAVKAA